MERLVAGLGRALSALVLDDLEVLHLHLQRAAAIRLDLAVDDEPLAALEYPLEIRLAEPDAVRKPVPSRSSTSSGIRGRPRGGGLIAATVPRTVVTRRS